MEIFFLLIALFVGILAGTFTGLAPGIHINLVSAILVASLSLSFLTTIPTMAIVVFIVSMSITHTFIDFIPSIYLGAPDEDNFLSILPGHSLLLQGKGHEAVVLTLYGSILAIPIILFLTPIFLFFLPGFFLLIKSIIPFILLFLSFYIILREDNILYSSIVFILSGAIGYLSFNLPIKEPLLPLLSGLFGLSNLFMSIKSKTSLPEQRTIKLKDIKLKKAEWIKSLLSAFIFSPLCSFLPGIGSGHAGTLSSEFSNLSQKSFILTIGAINTIIMGLSYVTVYAIGKARTGTAANVQSLLGTISSQNLIIILITIFLSGIIAFFIGISLSKIFSKNINKISYTKLTFIIISIIFIVNLIFTNWLGILVLLTSTTLGLFAISSNTRRINLMGCLILPSIIYYLF